ncbi:NAD-dependent epimerase/dehydratase family protein [Methylotenera sp. L2L1]|uniref:NAD-dependent epimerase/dehydratase family protein n=1 Tax=Methylotenera sp. L2L1 TaxID=1502770 RepID=UPI0005636862|nr:NAD-dependent epimerase/dehydratase family protein [Methylotenera sp. L2L1]
MNINRTSTLVIGGGGYIGSHLVLQLLKTERQVTVLGRSPIPPNKLPDGVVYVAGDFGQHELICKLLDKHQEVIYLAYATVPNTSFENPLVDLLQNLPPTVQLFSEAAKRGVKLILVSSGGTVYGESIELPILETHPTKPISPYGVTKLTLENYAYLYAATHGLKFVCVRPANAYGVGQRPFIGQGFIATAMASAMCGMPIKIFGQNGTVRDYLYVSDLAAGIVSTLQHGNLSETYNLGSGLGVTNLDVIKAFELLINDDGYKVKVENLPERPFDVKANVLDSTKLQTHTGWKPNVDFMDGLRLTYEWLRLVKSE